MYDRWDEFQPDWRPGCVQNRHTAHKTDVPTPSGSANCIEDLKWGSVLGRSRKQKVVIGNDFVWERLVVDGRCYHYKQVNPDTADALIDVVVRWKDVSVNPMDMSVSICCHGPRK